MACRHGTTGYRAPEQVRSNLQSQKSDIFSVGMVAADLAFPSFHQHLARAVKDSGDEATFYTSSDPERGLLPEGLEALLREHLVPACADDMEWVDIIRQCWHPLADCRPSAAALLQWLTQDYGVPAPQ